MTTIKIKGQKLSLRERAKYERKISFERYIESVKSFNELVEKLNGKTIEIKRINQAIEVYRYAGATWKKAPPQYWTANIDGSWGHEVGQLYLQANYRNTDIMTIK